MEFRGIRQFDMQMSKTDTRHYTFGEYVQKINLVLFANSVFVSKYIVVALQRGHYHFCNNFVCVERSDFQRNKTNVDWNIQW